MLDYHQVKVDDPFTGYFGFHPIATTVSDDDSDDHSISSSVVTNQIYVDGISDHDNSFQNEDAWTPFTAVETVASSLIVDVDHEQQIFGLIHSNDDSIVLDHIPSSANGKELEERAEASAPKKGRRPRFDDSKTKQHQRRLLQGRLLQASFKPNVWDVICRSKKKEAYDHIGNRRMRLLVANNLRPYLETPCRLKKSQLIRSIVDQIYEASPDAGFVQRDQDTGRWYAADRESAHDKIGHSFRDYVKKPHVRNSKSSAREKEMSLLVTQDKIFQGMSCI